MKSYPKIKRLGHEATEGITGSPVTILEKMDGANFRFTHGKNVDGVAGDRLVFGSKNVIYKNEKDTDSNFEGAVEYVRDQITPDEFADAERADDELTVFGEAMHSHTLDYEWDTVPRVLIFDVWSAEDGWLGWRDVKSVARKLGFETVPEVYTHREYESPTEIDPEIDSEYRDGFAEGVVIRNDKYDLKAKLRSEQFLDAFNGDKPNVDPHEEDDTAQLAHDLLQQEPWVKKQIHKYEDADRTIEMSIMEDLWRDVFDDIISEEYETVFLGDWQIDTKRFRSIIASHTAEELQAYLRRPDDSVLNEA